MLRDMEREGAARFSFLMSVPIMLAAGIYTGFDLLQVPDLSSFLLPMLVGFAVSAVVGFLAIRWLLKYLQNNPLYGFAVYLVVVSLLMLVLV
jgi:undecaprenyl-diphosphatase